ncbi:hypothetical protein HK097_000229 [Rhizophlyctis rosea]|uniref:Amino acid transporter transmembrane domain-containing protein n=1 Tax=Rhizophlyctis rosea TaxID=64517 RepID=A0AAD5X2R0_9FUNG|nr:hypothetical protein HK097_000229 [Rhizophlyctis rosea]
MTYLSFDNTLTHPPFSPTRILPTHRQDLLKPFLPTQTPHTQSTSHIHPTNHHLSTPGTCSTASSIFNTLNLLIGIGFLSLPYALRCSGLLPGLVIIISTCLLTNLTGHLLGKCLALSSKLGRSLSSYGDLGEAAFGSKARKWVSVVFLTELVVTCVAFVILIEDSLGAIFPEIETGVFRGIAFAVCLGAALVKNLTYISYASLVGIVGSLNLVGVILYNGVTSTKGPGSILDPMPISTFPENPVSTSFAVGIVMAGFAGHAVLPNIYLDMKDKSRYPFVLNVSFCIALTLYLTVAVAGYLMFGQQTLQEITMNLAALPGAKKSLNLFATALICFIPIPKYALTMAPVSQTADAYLGRFLHKSQSSSKPTEATPLISDTAHRPPKPSMTQYILIRVFLVSVTALIPFILPHFDTVLGLIGSFFTVAVSVVMPAAFYAKLTKGDESMKWVWAGCWTLVGIGALAGMLATVGMGVPGARPI